ncbi:MAG: AAA family ATPase [Oscillospiraceae bacterium]|nr:AAA family ATPase [Oscillospiraceae bacterium]
MSKGILIFGCAGAGKTTLGRELARQLQFHPIDLDEIYWRWDTKIPYTIFRSDEEIVHDLTSEIARHPNFVMSGMMGSFRGPFLPLFDLAVLLTVPYEIRMERLRAREVARFGDRVLAGGDMYESSKQFLALVRGDTDNPPGDSVKRAEQRAAELACPVLRVDGTKDIAENAAWIAEQFRQLEGL